MSDLDLLSTFCPLLQFDTYEHWVPCSPDTFVSCPAARLRGRLGEEIARPPKLSLDFLGPVYRNCSRSHGDHTLGIEGRSYEKMQALILKKHPEYRDIIYGRIKSQEGAVWLQYWIFYFYNGGLSMHEGDWEYCQILLKGGYPESIVLAQHRTREEVIWPSLKLHKNRPIVYVAQDTHAMYKSIGNLPNFDYCDGKGRLVDPKFQLLPEEGWVHCPVRVGDTRADPNKPWTTSSPPMPGRTKQWNDPNGWAYERRS